MRGSGNSTVRTAVWEVVACSAPSKIQRISWVVLMMIKEFLERREVVKELRRTVVAGRRSFVVDFERLLEFDLKLARELIYNPTDFLLEADKSLQDITKLPTMCLRVRKLDKTMEVGDIRANDVGKFIQVGGAITQADAMKFWGDGQGEFDDYQRVQVETLNVELYHDLIGRAKVGDRVVITGTLRPTPTETPNLFDGLLVANHIEKSST